MSDLVKNVNQENFQDEIMNSEKPVLVDFRAPWCMPCRVLGPVIDLLAEKYSNKVKFTKINVDENQELSKQFQITGIPNVKIIKNGEVIHNLIGVKHPDEYSQIIESL